MGISKVSKVKCPCGQEYNPAAIRHFCQATNPGLKAGHSALDSMIGKRKASK
jgi:hypothetical protein